MGRAVSTAVYVVSALLLGLAASCSTAGGDGAMDAGAADASASPSDGGASSDGGGVAAQPPLDAAGANDTGAASVTDSGVVDADSGASPPCTGTSDCTSGAVCCAHLTLGPDTFPACGIADAKFACEATCSTLIPGSCSTTLTARRCHSSADCTSSSNNLCCTITSLDGIAICANATVVAQHGGGVCH
jgi:hypothetical protein